MNGLTKYCGCIYVPTNEELRRDIIRLCHDTPGAGHSGRIKTTELVSRDFWWPGMSVFIRNYIRGCANCQSMKNSNLRSNVPLMPNEVPQRPFQIMTTDFITDLPPCKGYDSISVYVDRGYKLILQGNFAPFIITNAQAISRGRPSSHWEGYSHSPSHFVRI